MFEALWEEPDGSTISTMLQRAEGTLEERVAQVLPTLKVILLGGMQEPATEPARRSRVCCSRVRPTWSPRDPAGLTTAAVEEGLRWVSPIGTQTRRACAEIELGGATLPGGASLGVLVSSANRDEAVWGPTADAFDLTRPPSKPRGVRLRLPLLLGSPLLAGSAADRSSAAVRAPPGDPPRSGAPARVHRVGV